MIFFETWLSLMVEATKLFQGGYCASPSGNETRASRILMVTEPSESLIGSPAIFLRGGDQTQVLTHYRKIIAANSCPLFDRQAHDSSRAVPKR